MHVDDERPTDEKPAYVITLVHGTFAPDAEWTRPNSKLRSVLEHHLGGPERVRFEAFTWTGLFGSKFNNGHRYRLNGGRRLSKRLTKACNDYPRARHFIVAHSHGGNVALYALRESALRGKITGVVCIATPFIACQLRDVRSTLEHYPHVAWAVFAFAVMLPLFILLAIGLGKLLDLAAERSSFLWEPLVWVYATAFSVGAYFLFAKWPAKILWGHLIPWLQRWAAKKQQQAVDRLSLPRLPGQAVLCVRAMGDEAKRHLALIAGVADTPYWVWNATIYTALFLLTMVAAFLWPDFWPLRPSSLSWYERCRAAGAIAAATVALISVAHFAVLAVLPRVTRAHALGFGQEGILDNLLLRITARPSPEECVLTEKEHRLTGTGLRHSGLYLDDQVLNDIASWISLQPARAA